MCVEQCELCPISAYRPHQPSHVACPHYTNGRPDKRGVFLVPWTKQKGDGIYKLRHWFAAVLQGGLAWLSSVGEVTFSTHAGSEGFVSAEAAKVKSARNPRVRRNIEDTVFCKPVTFFEITKNELRRLIGMISYMGCRLQLLLNADLSPSEVYLISDVSTLM